MPTPLLSRALLVGLACPLLIATATAGAWAAIGEVDRPVQTQQDLTGLLAQTAPQQQSVDQAKLASIVARVCPTLEACQQGLAGLLIRLNVVQQQLIASQEQVNQFSQAAQNAEAARQDLEQGQARVGGADQADMQEQLDFKDAEIQRLTQARDEALSKLTQVAELAQEQARQAQALGQQVKDLQVQIRQLRFARGETGETSAGASTLDPLTSPTSEDATREQELQRLFMERDELLAELRRLKQELNGDAPTPTLGQRSLFAVQELERLKKELDLLTENNVRQEQELAASRVRISRQQKSMEDAQRTIMTLSQERDALLAQVGQDGTSGLEGAAQNVDQRALTDRLAELTGELDQARARIADLRQENSKLEIALEGSAGTGAQAAANDRELSDLQGRLQAMQADKAALERQLIKLEEGRRSSRDDMAALTAALQDRDQTIAALQDQVLRLQNQGQSGADSAAALQQAEAALRDERAARVQERSEFEGLLANLGSQNQELEQALASLRAANDEERRGLVAEITRLSDELSQLRSLADLQQAQSGEQQGAVARLTQALEDAEQRHSAQLDLLGRAEDEIKALLADLNLARTAVADSQAQRQKAINDALELRRLLDDLIQDRDRLAQEVARLKQSSEREAHQQAQLAASQQAFREVEADRDRLRALLADKQREALELSRQLQRRQAVIDAQTAVGRNYDLLVVQLNDAEAELVLARMQISSMQQRLATLDQQDSAMGATAQPQPVPQAQSSLQPCNAAPTAGGQPLVPESPVQNEILQADPNVDARTLRLLEELRRIGR